MKLICNVKFSVVSFSLWSKSSLVYRYWNAFNLNVHICQSCHLGRTQFAQKSKKEGNLWSSDLNIWTITRTLFTRYPLVQKCLFMCIVTHVCASTGGQKKTVISASKRRPMFSALQRLSVHNVSNRISKSVWDSQHLNKAWGTCVMIH